MLNVKRWIAKILILSMICSNAIYFSPSKRIYADEKKMSIEEIFFTEKHEDPNNPFNVTGGEISFLGQNLDPSKILYARKTTSGYVPFPQNSANNNSGFFMKIVLTAEETKDFKGEILVNVPGANKKYKFSTENVPYIMGSDKRYVDFSDPGAEGALTLQFSNNENPSPNLKISYGNTGVNETVIPYNGEENLQFRPKPSPQFGAHSISVGETLVDQPGLNPGENVTLKTEYKYHNIFILTRELDLAPLSLYPNVGTKGSSFLIESDKIKTSEEYRVYFLDNGEDGDNLEDFRMYAVQKNDFLKQNGKQKMRVRVPNNIKFKTGEKTILVVRVVNGEIVARSKEILKFYVIDGRFAPTISLIKPDSGSDEGAEVQIVGKNILLPDIPSMVGKVPKPSFVHEGIEQKIDYNIPPGSDLTFNNVKVNTLRRTFIVTAGRQAKVTHFDVQGKSDFIDVKLDAIGSPAPVTVDVLIETVTTIGTVDGKTYEFKQSAIKKDGFTFINSSIKPSIESVNPEIVEVIPGGGKFRPKSETLISIEGKGFFVNKYTDENSNVIVNYPKVFIQETDRVGEQPYLLKIDKKDAPQGMAYVKVLGPIQEEFLLKDPALGDSPDNRVLVEMLVLNDKNKIVTGSRDNEVGSRIVLYLPKQFEVKRLGGAYVQVINPKRKSFDYGTHGISDREAIFFRIAKNAPVISSVVPNIVPITGKQEVVVSGANFDEGVKVFIDGKEVPGVKRTSNEAGNEMLLIFQAPEGREGKTQIQVINPDGGNDVKEFHYINSLGQDPKLISISPNKGSAHTLVVASGDNFVRPNPTAKTTIGLDAFKLIGTRVFLDGRDVNDYKLNQDGGILFTEYSKPAEEGILKVEKGKAQLSSLYRNATLEDLSFSRFYEFTKDDKGAPALFDGAKLKFSFRADGAELYALDETGREIRPVVVSADRIEIGNGPTKTEIQVHMDNHILRLAKDKNGVVRADVADYADAIILKEVSEDIFYTLKKEINKELILSSGGTKYKIFAESKDPSLPPSYQNTKLVARDKNNNAFEISRNDTGFSFQGLNFVMTTPYIEEDGIIVGKKVDISSKTTLHFVVPSLSSGTGYKEVKVVNPDTQSDRIEKGFYYYHQPATHPVISSILPNRGSVSGGYLVTISGHDFFDTSTVFFGGIPVSQEDKSVAIDGKSMQVKVPAYPVDISSVFGVGEISVPVTVVNSDGASYSVERGFTYVKPASTPRIKELKLDKGSSTGGELVVITGEDFRFFEPYINMPGGTYEYEEGIDIYTDLNAHLSTNPAKWDDLLRKNRKYKEQINGIWHEVDLWEGKPFENGKSYYGYTEYFDSKILPSVFFGTQKARIVEFDTNYLKVLTPPGKGKAVDVSLVNNDSGVSNTLKYTYSSSDPKIEYINPSSGARVGSESREILGSNFYSTPIKIYKNSDFPLVSEIVLSNKVDTLLRFGDLSNIEVPIGSDNDGRINANHAVVRLEGGLRVSFDGKKKELHVSIEEGGFLYQRNFGNFDGEEVFIPVNQLKDAVGNYYKPFGFKYQNDKIYNEDSYYELISVKIDKIDKRLLVSRGYSPENKLDSNGKIRLKTPSYYTIGKVKVYFFNSDGGTATTEYTYTNPASNPIILSAKPMDILPKHSNENTSSEDQRIVQASLKGGSRVEIEVMDLRDDPKLFFGTKEVKILEIINNPSTQTIIAEVPAGTEAEIGVKKPIIVQNKDGGTAISDDKKKLGSDKRLMYFVYRKPLSDPEIKEITPKMTSQYGGHLIELKGTDIRQDANVILGSKGGIPVRATEVDSFGRFLKFLMPSGLKPGFLDIQIQNSDFGLVTMKDAIKIISYPELDSRISDEKNSSTLHLVSTEGGQVITLKGKNFMEGAKVFFGGERKEFNAENANGIKGFFKDDKYYVLQGAVEAAKVEFVDANTLKVVTPKISNEKMQSITVLNPDEGISDGDLQIKYSLPKPSATRSLKASIVNDKYIKLYDYVSKDADYYTIYAYIGEKKERELKKDKYNDFKALETTDREPYKISSLEGLNTSVKNQLIHFVVKAVNDYGSSSWSNIATLKYEDFKRLEFPRGKKKEPVEDQDGGFRPYADLKLAKDRAEFLFTKAPKQVLKLKLGEGKTHSIKDYEFLFSKYLVNGSADIALESPLFYLTLNPKSFGGSVFTEYLNEKDAYGIVKLTWKEDFNTSSAKSSLVGVHRNLKTVSPIVKVQTEAKTGGGTKPVSSLNQAMKFAFKLNSPEIVYDKNKPIYLYRYEIASGTWKQVNYDDLRSAGLLRFYINGSSYYVLCQQH